MYFEEIRALLRLADAGEPAIAGLATAVLSMVELLRDAEIRAGMAEAMLNAEQTKLGAIRDLIAGRAQDGASSNIVRDIASVLT
jgi:hypothetical protein